MARLIWSVQGSEDVESIAEYIGQSSPANAREFIQQVKELAASLPQQPRLGSMVPEWEDENLRERLLNNFRVIYRIRDEDVIIVTVVRGSRRLPRKPSG